jgi:hypothetical protein
LPYSHSYYLSAYCLLAANVSSFKNYRCLLKYKSNYSHFKTDTRSSLLTAFSGYLYFNGPSFFALYLLYYKPTYAGWGLAIVLTGIPIYYLALKNKNNHT